MRPDRSTPAANRTARTKALAPLAASAAATPTAPSAAVVGIARRPTRSAWIRTSTLAACIIPLASCTVAPSPAPTGGHTVSAEPPDVAIERFVALAQAARRDAGCPTLTWDARAANVAAAHSQDMLRRGYFSHRSPESTTPFDRMRAAGIRFSAAAENIAYGVRTGEAAFRQWMGSAGHRRNLLNCRYTRHGVGVAGDRWTHVLFAP